MSDSGASAITSNAANKSAISFLLFSLHLEGPTVSVSPPARLFAVRSDMKRAVMYPRPRRIHLADSLISISQAAGQNKSSFSLVEARWTKIRY